ncbi:Purine nucleoside phosphorylase [Mucinivorans hirudinis]|uniref:Purine nucleoside phosphorylase n=1 Tax=Mucinivorans hirudinis TaxID=1433126 RepID=A0A060RCT0_9BACT|nr:Purine nucleoside phosphorylase [Mucinivorans hirudinis]
MLERIKKIKSLILNKMSITQEPEIAIILGSGLGGLVDEMEVMATLDYADIEGFPLSTVEGHRGRFVWGTLGGRRVIAMQGRVHYYEGYSIDDVALGARVLCSFAIRALIVSNAAGGVNPSFNVGDLMVIEDHINLLPNPLIGKNIESLGTRFPEMTTAYDKALITLAHSLDPDLREGVYLASSGPTFETPAEYRFFHRIGADACGMSTTAEVIVARHQRIPVFGLSLITNIGYGAQAGKATHQEVFTAAAAATPRMTKLIKGVVEQC